MSDLVLAVRDAADEPAGALVLLHGRGADEHDLAPLLDVLDPDRRLVGLTPRAPLPGPAGGHWWYRVPRVGYPDHDSFHATYRTLASFLDDQLAQRGIGWDETVIGGFSMGCVMSLATGLGPGRPSPAGILAMSGFIPAVDGWEPDLREREGLAVLITHGARDPVISVELGRAARARLQDAGLEVEYHEHAGGHQLDPATLPRMAGWLGERYA